MRTQTIRDFLTGLTAIIGIAGLCFMLILFGEMKDVTQSFYYVTLYADNAGGLKDTSPITLNGVRIGQVVGAKLREPPAHGVELRLRITSGNHVPTKVEISVDKALIGEAVLELTVPPTLDEAGMRTTLKDGDVLETGQLSNMFTKLANSVEGPLNRLGKTADNIDKLAATYTALGERLTEMVEPRTPAEVDAGKPANVRSTITRIDKAIADADTWLTDKQLREDAKNLIAKANSVLDQASELAKAWTGTAATTDKAIADVGAKAGTVLDQGATTLGTANAALAKVDKAAGELAILLEGVNQGKGTAGQMAQNPDLYNALRDSAQRLDRALVEFQLLVEKLKAEGIKIGL